MPKEPPQPQISLYPNKKLMDDVFFSLGTIQSEIAYGIDRLKSNMEIKELLSTFKNNDDKEAFTLNAHLTRLDTSTKWLKTRIFHQIHQLEQIYNELMINSEFSSATESRKIIKKT